MTKQVQKQLKKIRNKSFKDAIRRLAGNPSEKEIAGVRIFKRMARSYKKDELICFIIYQDKERREQRRQYEKFVGDIVFGKEKNILKEKIF